MMSVRRHLLSLLLCLAAVTALAAQPVDSVLVRFGVDADPARVQVTVRTDCRRWSLLWDYRDSANYRMATIERQGPAFENDDYDYQSRVTVSACVAGKVSDLRSRRVSHTSPVAGLRIARDTEGAFTLTAGDDDVIVTGNDDLITLSALPGSQIRYRADTDKSKPRNNTVVIERVPKITAPFASLEQLKDYLRQSRDSIEGLWEFMDRDIPAGKITLGGNYVLATVRDSSHPDKYNIYYISGARRYADLWQPMQLKGTLTATVFADHFDLSWTEALRTAAYTDEAYATIDTGHTIMSIFIPLINTRLRFRRLPVGALK